MKVLIVDDEAPARLRLAALLAQIDDPPVQLAGEAADADAALRWLRLAEADVLLLDIRMPGRSGIALAQALRTMARAPAVVFVTAHAEHAVGAFELDAVDYLTKPVRRERLQAALQRVQQRRRAAAEAPVLVVHDRGRVLRLPVADVLYLKAELKYVTLRTADASYLLDDALADLEQRLAALGAPFVRVHRNALVARHAVRALEKRSDDGDEGWAVRVSPSDEWLAVSRRQLPLVREALGP